MTMINNNLTVTVATAWHLGKAGAVDVVAAATTIRISTLCGVSLHCLETKKENQRSNKLRRTLVRHANKDVSS